MYEGWSPVNILMDVSVMGWSTVLILINILSRANSKFKKLEKTDKNSENGETHKCNVRSSLQMRGRQVAFVLICWHDRIRLLNINKVDLMYYSLIC